MGGIAFRAPVLATLFLIVALATLAMPGSSNFVGEFLILLGVFKAKLVIAIIAFTGVVLASVYALRLFIRAMHNRVGPSVDSRELSLRDGVVLVPLVARDPVRGASTRSSRCTAARRAVKTAVARRRPSRQRRAGRPLTRPPPPPKGPHVDFAGALAADRAARRRDARAARRPAAAALGPRRGRARAQRSPRSAPRSG